MVGIVCPAEGSGLLAYLGRRAYGGEDKKTARISSGPLLLIKQLTYFYCRGILKCFYTPKGGRINFLPS